MNAQTIFKAYNAMTRRMEKVTPESELQPGQKVLRYYWCNSIDGWVTIPGASEFVVTDNFELRQA